jgi:flagellin-like hook-associated protein FlgL
VRECEALECAAPAKHYTANPSSLRNLHLCYAHNEMHRQGIGFTVIPDHSDQPSVGVLTPDPVDAILELLTPAAPATPTAAGGAMYSTISKATSILQDSYNEADEALDEIRSRISELEDAASELENIKDNLQNAISSLEDLDGASVSVSVEGFDFDLSL